MTSILLETLRAQINKDFTGLRANPNDPPDVLFECADRTVGLELVELVPENRFAKDHQLRRLRELILDRLPIGEITKGWALSILLTNDYATKLAIPKGIEDAIAENFVDFLQSGKSSASPQWITVPSQLESTVAALCATASGVLPTDPRLRCAEAPLVTFGAQTTRVVPTEDFPKLVLNSVVPKLIQDVPSSTWLLIWATHPALLIGTDELFRYIATGLALFPSGYERVFFLECGPTGTLWDLPSDALQTVRASGILQEVLKASPTELLKVLKEMGNLHGRSR